MPSMVSSARFDSVDSFETSMGAVGATRRFLRVLDPIGWRLTALLSHPSCRHRRPLRLSPPHRPLRPPRTRRDPEVSHPDTRRTPLVPLLPLDRYHLRPLHALVTAPLVVPDGEEGPARERARGRQREGPVWAWGEGQVVGGCRRGGERGVEGRERGAGEGRGREKEEDRRAQDGGRRAEVGEVGRWERAEEERSVRWRGEESSRWWAEGSWAGRGIGLCGEAEQVDGVAGKGGSVLACSFELNELKRCCSSSWSERSGWVRERLSLCGGAEDVVETRDGAEGADELPSVCDARLFP